MDIQNIQEPSLPTVCPNSFVTCWIKTIQMWKCCVFPWELYFPRGAVGVPTGRAAVVRKALRSLWENCQPPPFVLELAGEVISLCDHWRGRCYPPLPVPWKSVVQYSFRFCSFVLDCYWQIWDSWSSKILQDLPSRNISGVLSFPPPPSFPRQKKGLDWCQWQCFSLLGKRRDLCSFFYNLIVILRQGVDST